MVRRGRRCHQGKELKVFPGRAIGLFLLFAACPAAAHFGAEDWAGREKLSVEDLELAVEANPRNVQSLVAQGMARLDVGDPDKAAKSFEAAVTADRGLGPAYVFLAWACNEQPVE